MADGLLLSRRERARAYWTKTALALAPTGVLAIVAVGIGDWAVAVAMLVVATLGALVAGQSARTSRGALVTGVVVAAGLFLLQLVLAWLITHPVVQP
jgi:hypothetical protein